MIILYRTAQYILQHIINCCLFLYKVLVSPYLPMACRFYPTCSVYMRDAIKIHGIRRGLWLGVKRLCRCQPFGGDGIDFVPEAHYCKHTNIDKG